MKTFYFYILFLFTGLTYSQNVQLANQYYSHGEYEKALSEYKLLFNKYPYNKNYLYRLVDIYQKTGNFSEAEKLLTNNKEKKNPVSQVWLAHNYLLQKDSVHAQHLFDKAIKQSMKSAYYVYQTSKALQEIYQTDIALDLYRRAKKRFPQSTFILEEAKIYAEKNKPQKMMGAYLDYLKENPEHLLRVRYLLTPYINSEQGNHVVDIIKKTIIERIKEEPLPVYYRLLEWIYIQEQDYSKAFFQLKSLYAKKEAKIEEIYYLADKAMRNRQTKTANRIFRYVIDHSENTNLLEKAKIALLQLQINESQKKNDELQDMFNLYLNESWNDHNSSQLKIMYADFLAFHHNNPDMALKVLSELLEQPLGRVFEAKVKLKQGDIYMQQGLFNKALLIYTQVQLDFPNHALGYLATYKIAQASFFKGDIEWAHNQLKVIKSIHSDLISNDAIDLDMLIINNIQENDSLQKPLKEMARVKYLIFKNEKEKAISTLDSLKFNYKGQDIYDDILWTQANLYEEKRNFDKALSNYKEIIQLPSESIYIDDALFRMATIYENHLSDFIKAKELYKKIIIEFPGSFWFTDARKAYRRLRGDDEL
jgi:tetratricopeptide (TPR) repeat protein